MENCVIDYGDASWWPGKVNIPVVKFVNSEGYICRRILQLLAAVGVCWRNEEIVAVIMGAEIAAGLVLGGLRALVHYGQNTD